MSECYRSALHEIYDNMSQNQVTSSLNNSINADVNQVDDIDARNGIKRDSKKDGATFIIRQHGDRNKMNGNHNDDNNEGEEDEDSSTDGPLTVRITGMGSSASLTFADIAEGILDRVNTRNSTDRTSSPIVVSVFSSVSGGILGPALGSQNVPIISACVSKKCLSNVPVPVHFEDLGSAFTSDLKEREGEVGLEVGEDDVCNNRLGDVDDNVNNVYDVDNANDIDNNVIYNDRNSDDVEEQRINEFIDVSIMKDSVLESISLIDSRSRSRSELKVEEQKEEELTLKSRVTSTFPSSPSPSPSPVFIEVSPILFNFDISDFM